MPPPIALFLFWEAGVNRIDFAKRERELTQPPRCGLSAGRQLIVHAQKKAGPASWAPAKVGPSPRWMAVIATQCDLLYIHTCGHCVVFVCISVCLGVLAIGGGAGGATCVLILGIMGWITAGKVSITVGITGRGRCLS